MANGSEEDHDGHVKVIPGTAKNKGQSKLPKDRKFTIEDLWAEVQMLRAALQAAESRAETLEIRVKELEQENAKLRKAARSQEDFLQKHIRKLQKDVADRDEKIGKLNKQLAWLRKQVFGETTEKQRPEPSEATEGGDEATKVDKKAVKKSGKNRGQQPGSKGHGRTDHSGVPLSDTVPLEMPNGCKCTKCGKPYRELSVTKDTDLLEISLMLYRILYQQHKYVSQCQCEGRKIVTAPAPPRLYPRTNIGNSLWVYLLVQKFLHGVPTNRTLKDLSLYGLSLAEGTIAGGFSIIDGLLEKLAEEIIKHCKGADLWNADETTWRIFDAGTTKWWMWLIACEDAVAYVLDPSRSSKVPSDFFAGSTGVLMTDRLASYKSIQDAIKKAWCWVHVRRDIYNLFIGAKKYKTWAKWWLTEIGTLFALAENRFGLWQQNKTLGRAWDTSQKAVEQQVERLELRWESELNSQKLDDEQKKVLRSMKRHWPGLTLFVQDARIPLHNNRAERLLRNAVILRKNSFGSGSEWSGKLAAKLFSIFQTWLINGLDPQALLLDYFNECAKTPGRSPPDISQFLPWSMSADRKELFALPESYKRPG